MPESLTFKMEWGFHGILRLLTTHAAEFSSVLDVGAGSGEHTRFFRLFGKNAYSLDMQHPADYKGDFMELDLARTFDLVWCSHVLERQRNVGAFIEKLFRLTADNGLLALCVPADRGDAMAGGQLTRWNAGTLIYNLILAGFDCSQASFIQDNDLCLIVRKRPLNVDVRPLIIKHELSDIAKYFPFPVAEGGNAALTAHNWVANYLMPAIGRPVHVRLETSRGVIEASLV